MKVSEVRLSSGISKEQREKLSKEGLSVHQIIIGLMAVRVSLKQLGETGSVL